MIRTELSDKKPRDILAELAKRLRTGKESQAPSEARPEANRKGQDPPPKAEPALSIVEGSKETLPGTNDDIIEPEINVTDLVRIHFDVG